MEMELKSIYDILSTQYIVIPEIQREYVWGNNRKLLEQFIREVSNAETEVNVGFLYSYIPERDTGTKKTVFLIDGQQRFTTLVLMLYYLAEKENRREDFLSLLNCRGTMMKFSYRVRSATDDFLRKLFMDSGLQMKQEIESGIKDKSWYTPVYDNDPSIQAMLGALKTIHENMGPGETELYNTIAGKVRFWYFNTEETSQGEELYITMNSRGETLQPYENIKPLLFEKLLQNGGQDQYNVYGKKWDDWEEFFYELVSGQDIRLADAGMNSFLRIVIELISCKEHTEIRPAEDINEPELTLPLISGYFEALKKISSQYPEEVKQLPGKGDLLLLKALLTVYIKAGNTGRAHRRVYKIIGNGCRRNLINNVPLLRFLRKFRDSDLPFYDFIHSLQPEELENVFDRHELDKIGIYRETNDTETEELFWQAEELPVTKGMLKCIWYEKFTENDKTKLPWRDNDKTEFKERLELFGELFQAKHIRIPLSRAPQNGITDNSLIARALITVGDYTINTGGKNWCFGYGDRWTDIMNTPKAYPVVSGLITQLYEDKSKDSLYQKLQKITANYMNRYDLTQKDSRYYIVKYPDSLQALNEGQNIVYFEEGWDNYRIDVINKARMNSFHINLFKYLVYKHYPHSKDFKQWLKLPNGLTLDCAGQHGWCILYKDEKMAEGIKEQFKAYLPEHNAGEKLFLIPVDIQKDLIEEGISILEKMDSYGKAE